MWALFSAYPGSFGEAGHTPMELKYGGGEKVKRWFSGNWFFPSHFLYSETSEQKALELRARLMKKWYSCVAETPEACHILT